MVAFVSAVLHPDDDLGEIHWVAVNPDRQLEGIGIALTDHDIAWIREAEMALVMVEKGDDLGLAPARRCYERVGFSLWSVARLFKAL